MSKVLDLAKDLASFEDNYNFTDGTYSGNFATQTMFRNKIINGDMRIAQRGTSSSTSGKSGMQIDRFQCEFAGASVTHSQEILGSGLPYDNGFRYFYRMTNTSVSNTVTDYSRFTYKFESQDISSSGWNYKDSSSSITISFYARSSLTGTYYLQLYAPNGPHQTRKSYTLEENVWKKIELTINGNSNLVFNNDVNHGLTIYIPAFYGTNWTDSSSSLTDWQDYVNSNQTPDYIQNWCNTSSATFDITGIQLEVGFLATPFEHRPIGMELSLCQRYFEKSYEIGTSVGSVTRLGSIDWNFGSMTSYGTVNIFYKVTKRATPTVKNYDPDTADTIGLRYWNGSAEVQGTGSLDGWYGGTSSARWALGSTSRSNALFHWTAEIEL